MVETDILQKLFKASPNSIINHSLEFVADVNPRVNSYFRLSDCDSEEDVQAKVLEWLSRDAYKSTHYRTNKKNEEMVLLLGSNNQRDEKETDNGFYFYGKGVKQKATD